MTKTRKSFLIIAFLGLTVVLPAQQAAQYSLFMLNPFYQNPAYAGMDFAISAAGGVRRQWVGLADAPSTEFLTAHAPFEILHGGVGFKLERDLYGAEQTNWVSLAYNYHLKLGNGILGIAIGGGIAQKKLDGAKLRTPEGYYRDNSLDHQDALLPIGTVQGQAPTLETGLFYVSEVLELGVGVRHLNTPNIDLITLQSKRLPTWYTQFGMHVELTRQLTLHPTVQVKTDHIQLQTDAGFRLKYAENIFTGVFLRGYNSNSLDAISILAGGNLHENWKIAYSYDLPLSALRQAHDGSHEVMLSFSIPKILGARRAPKIIYNPRNL